MVLRLLTAVGVGAEYAAINAAISEFIPARHRGKTNARASLAQLQLLARIFHFRGRRGL
jgi:MFS family permease